MAILYEITTRNGKGTLCESILKVLGAYACASRPETLALKNKVNRSGPSEEIARLAEVRFVNIPEQGKTLKSEFTKEEIKSAILNQHIEGYKLLQKEELTILDLVKEATLKYSKESDKIAIFMEDCLEEGNDYEVRTSKVYERYRSWSLENGYYNEVFKQADKQKLTR